MKIIFLGDIFGKPGRNVVFENIERLKSLYSADVFIINGENLADGKGLTEKTTKPLFEAGVNVITSGNHLWDRADSHEYIRREPRIVKPMNYPSGAWGSQSYSIDTSTGKLTVICLTGQMFMSACDMPFFTLDRYLNSHPETGSILLDFHAESTAEKRFLALAYDGQVSAVIGTHTHIQTADEEILPEGTGYLTDAGMTGPHDSVIGVKKHLIIEKMRSGMPVRYEVSDQGLQINGVFLEIDGQSHKTVQISRIRELLNNG